MILKSHPFFENSMRNRLRFVKSQTLLAIGLLTFVPTTFFATPSPAQTPPATTYQPGFWQPSGRFNPKQPVKINLVNKTGLVLDYDITNLDSFSPDMIPSGDTRRLENFGEDAYIMVYPSAANSPDPDQPYLLKFSVEVDAKTQMIPADNIATITITKATSNIDERFYGHRAINLQKNGGIYFY